MSNILNKPLSGIRNFISGFRQYKWPASGRLFFFLRIFIVIALAAWLGSRGLDHGLFRYMVLLVALLTIAGLCWGGRVASSSYTPSPYQMHWRIDAKIPWVVFSFLIFALSYLEWREPLFFTQDDTHSAFLPMIIYAGRGVFDEGIFPTWSGYNMLGMPLATTGTLMLTYPLTYVAYGIARFFIGNELLTIEVLAWMHFMAGYLFGYRALRTLGIGRAISSAAIFSYIFLGYNLIAGRSWACMLPTIAWLPALGWSLAILASGRTISWRWVLATAAAIGLIFHSSHTQDAVYAACFWGIGAAWIMVWNIRRGFTFTLPIICAALGGIAIALIVMVPQYLELKEVPRIPNGLGILGAVKSMLLPYPVVISPHVFGGGSGVLYYSGSLFIWAFFAKCMADMIALGRYQLQPTRAASAAFTLIGAIALIYSFGSEGKLWDWLAMYPPFSKFRWPFRLLPFAIFFMTMAGALFLQSVTQRWKYGGYIAYGMASLVLVLVAYNIMLPQTPFFRWADRPYPALTSEMQQLQVDGFSTKGRGWPHGHWRSSQPNYSLTLNQNYPSFYKIPVATGYVGGTVENGLPASRVSAAIFNRDPERFYREYAIEWISLSTLPNEPPFLDANSLQRIKDHAKSVLRLNFMDIYFIADQLTKPMVHTRANPFTPLEYKLEPNGITVKLDAVASARSSHIILAFTFRPWFRAWDEQGNEHAVHADSMGRLAVSTPPGVQKIFVRYCPPWRYGMLPAVILIMLAIFLMYARRWFHVLSGKATLV